MAGIGLTFDKLAPDQTALNVCSAANIDLLSNKRITLTQLSRGLQSSVHEIERGSKWDDVLSRALLTANLIKATCEAFLEMAGALGDAAGLKGAGLVAKSGVAGMAIAGSTSSAINGQSTDWVSTTNKILGVGIQKSMPDGTGKHLADLQTMKVDIVNSAVRGESVAALQTLFLSYLPKIAEMSLEVMKKETAAKWTSAASGVASAGLSYSRALEEAFNARISDQVEFSDRKTSLLVMVNRQVNQVKLKIAEIDYILQLCGQAIPAGRLA